jgi:copper chaperone CopZ
MWTPRAALLALTLATACAAIAVEVEGESPRPFKHRITGLFADSREPALRDALAQIPGIELVSLDLEEAEAVLEYDPAKLFPGAKPDQVTGRLDELLRSVSNHTLGVKPPRTLPLAKLQKVEIGVTGLDCEACSLALYEILDRLEGVELVKASFREGRVIAWIDATKTDRPKLVAALKRRHVVVRSP